MNERTELRAMIEHASEWAERHFRKHGVVAPVWHAVTEEGKHMMLIPPGPDKDTSALLMRVLFEIENVVRCVFIDEAWTLAEKKPGLTEEEAEAHRQHMFEHGIADHPDRREVVIFNGEDEMGMLVASRSIIRTGKKATLGPLNFIIEQAEGGQWEGRLIGMLPRRAGARVQ